MQNLVLAFETEIADDVFGGGNVVGTQSQPRHGGGKPSASEPIGSDKNCVQAPSFSAPYPKFNCRVPRPLSEPQKTEVRDRLGKVIMRVADAKLEALHNAGLVEYRGRRHVTHAILRPGISVASLHATLRAGIRHTLPIAEDNRTVQRRSVAGGGTYFEIIHEAAWDDLRPLPGTLGERERGDE